VQIGVEELDFVALAQVLGGLDVLEMGLDLSWGQRI
jgi:hypothetical protein